MDQIKINHNIKKLIKQIMTVIIIATIGLTIGLYVGSHWPEETKTILEKLIIFFEQALSQLSKIMSLVDQIINLIRFLQSIKQNK